jgi:glycosyltransferase involved in cell wall biosynthesis
MPVISPLTAQPDMLGSSRILRGVMAVIPAYNEELVIGSVVLKTREVVEKVIIVDDGSHDSTSAIARLAGAEVVKLDENTGKAYAMLLGLQKAREAGCRAAVTLDGDGQHNSWEIPSVVRPVLEGKADLVIGSRFLATENAVPAYRRVGQKTLDIFTTMGAGVRTTDSQSGFRAFSPKALDNLDFVSSGYNVESDMIAHFASRGLVIQEAPITVRYEVPHKHKKNPVTHGMGVFGRVINLISYRRPLLTFGIPGAILLLLCLITGFFAFAQYYTTSKFPFELSMASVALLILSLLLLTAGLILNVLIYIFERIKIS